MLPKQRMAARIGVSFLLATALITLGPNAWGQAPTQYVILTVMPKPKATPPFETNVLTKLGDETELKKWILGNREVLTEPTKGPGICHIIVPRSPRPAGDTADRVRKPFIVCVWMENPSTPRDNLDALSAEYANGWTNDDTPGKSQVIWTDPGSGTVYMWIWLSKKFTP